MEIDEEYHGNSSGGETTIDKPTTPRPLTWVQNTVATLKIGAAQKACDLARMYKRYNEAKCNEMKTQEIARLDPANATIDEHTHI